MTARWGPPFRDPVRLDSAVSYGVTPLRSDGCGGVRTVPGHTVGRPRKHERQLRSGAFRCGIRRDRRIRIYFAASHSKRLSSRISDWKAVAVVFAEHGVHGTAEFAGAGDDKRSDQSTDEFSGTVRFTAPVAGSPAMPARTRR